MWAIFLCLWLWTISLLIFFKPPSPPPCLFVCFFYPFEVSTCIHWAHKKAQHHSQCFFERIYHNKYFIIIFSLSFYYVLGRLEKSCLATTARIFSLHRTCWISAAATTTMATNKSAAAACSTTTGTECMTINFYFYVVFCIFSIHMNVERFTAPL